MTLGLNRSTVRVEGTVVLSTTDEYTSVRKEPFGKSDCLESEHPHSLFSYIIYLTTYTIIFFGEGENREIRTLIRKTSTLIFSGVYSVARFISWRKIPQKRRNVYHEKLIVVQKSSYKVTRSTCRRRYISLYIYIYHYNQLRDSFSRSDMKKNTVLIKELVFGKTCLIVLLLCLQQYTDTNCYDRLRDVGSFRISVYPINRLGHLFLREERDHLLQVILVSHLLRTVRPWIIY